VAQGLHQSARVAKCSRSESHQAQGGNCRMRAEIETIVAEIKQSIGLLRRHL
jgi:hypothetical protein